MSGKRISLFLICILLLVAGAIAETAPSSQTPAGKSVPAPDMRWDGYEYRSAEALAADIRAANSPASVDIRPAVVPLEDLIRLREELPETNLYCNTELYGAAVDTAALSIDLSRIKLTDTEALEDALGCFPRVETIDMCDCGLANEQMEALCERQPDIRFIWRVRFGHWTLRTDATAFSTLNSNDSPAYTSREFSVLRYCVDLRALDLGHNRITDLTWIESLTELRVLILADNDIVDIRPLAKLENLEYVELFMNDIVDVTPLSGLQHILDLNLCHNKVTDCSSLKSLKSLERLWFSYNRELPEEQTTALAEALPDCLCNFTIYYSTHAGWRGHDRYWVIKEIFATGKYLPWDADVPHK